MVPRSQPKERRTATYLNDSPVFGPVRNRRLGPSLGVNMMPAAGKICSFDCLYCDNGFNAEQGVDLNNTKDEYVTPWLAELDRIHPQEATHLHRRATRAFYMQSFTRELLSPSSVSHEPSGAFWT